MNPLPPASFTVDDVVLTPLHAGADRFAALIGLIGNARRTLRLFYYMFAEDHAGTQVRDALLAATRRGVAVSLTIDSFGSTASDAFLRPLEAAGASICRFLPRLGRRYLLRNHQKMALADERHALIGGFNISDAYFADSGRDCWRDLGLLVEGPPVARLAGYYDVLHQWSRRARAPIRELRRDLRQWSAPDGPVRWLLGGPARWLNPWVQAVRHDLRHARQFDLVSAYFVPNPAMLRRIEAVGRHGVARLLTAGRSDSDITIAAARHSYRRLLRNGVEIAEYRAAKLHTKLLVIDNAVYIGSANFDMRSLFLNLELMLRIEDVAFAEHMRAHALAERREAQQVTPELHARRSSWLARLRWGLAYLVVGVLDSGITRRLNFGWRWR